MRRHIGMADVNFECQFENISFECQFTNAKYGDANMSLFALRIQHLTEFEKQKLILKIRVCFLRNCVSLTP